MIVFTLPVGIWVQYAIHPLHLLFTPVAVFGFIPALDWYFGQDLRNPDPVEEERLSEVKLYRYIVWASAFLVLALVIWGAYIATRPGTGPLTYVLLALAIGINSGALGINMSHELIHRVNSRIEPALGRMILMTVFYMHWAIEHVAGHHRWVATPGDPATARLGQSFYSFWPQTVFGSFRSAWDIERGILKRRGKKVWGPSNRVLRYMAIQVGFVLALAVAFGPLAIPFYFMQAFVAVTLLESVNYMEHYGLERKQLEDGSYEKVRPEHSWTQSSRVTNLYLVNLQRHSDHHYDPRRRYQILRHYEDSPQLPAGYAAMVPITLVPPLWRKVMDKRVPASSAANGGENR